MAVDLTPPVITTADIASTIPARVVKRDTGGRQVDDFQNDGTTRPSQSQVASKITDAEGDVYAELGFIFNSRALARVTEQDVIDRLKRAWRSVIINRTVYLVEKTYWPEQLRDESNIANSYLEDYRQGLESLRGFIQRLRNSEDGSGDDEDLSGINTNQVLFNFTDGEECRSEHGVHPGGYIIDLHIDGGKPV